MTHALFYIRWRFVIHAGIDGYSRMVVFIHCSTNNRAETKLLLANPYANIEGQRIVVIPQQCKQRRTL